MKAEVVTVNNHFEDGSGEHSVGIKIEEFGYIFYRETWTDPQEADCDKFHQCVELVNEMSDIYNKKNENGFEKFFNPKLSFYLSDQEWNAVFFIWLNGHYENFRHAADFFIQKMLKKGYKFKGIDAKGNLVNKFKNENILKLLSIAVESTTDSEVLNSKMLLLSGNSFLNEHAKEINYKENNAANSSQFSPLAMMFPEPASMQ
jgi:hypothetical protein